MKTIYFAGIYLLIIIVVQSCQSGTEPNDDQGEPITIHVEGAKFDIIESEKVLANSEFVFLESKEESHFGDMSYFLASTDEFYVFDPYTKNMVFRFNKGGEFLNTIGTKGGGPGEYNSSVDALVDGDKIEILSNNISSDVYRYSIEGIFIEKKTYEPKYPASFIKVTESTDYLFYCSYGDYKVLRTDTNGTITDSILFHKQADRISMSIDAMLGNADGSVLLNEALYNIIWGWTGNSFQEKYILDFGDYTFYQGEKDEERYFENEQNKGRWSVRWYQENSNYLFLTLFFMPPDVQAISDITIKHLLYSKNERKTFQLAEDDVNLCLQWPFAITEDNLLYLSGSPVEMSEWDAWMNVVKERNLPFDIEGNPIVIIVDLDELIR